MKTPVPRVSPPSCRSATLVLMNAHEVPQPSPSRMTPFAGHQIVVGIVPGQPELVALTAISWSQAGGRQPLYFAYVDTTRFVLEEFPDGTVRHGEVDPDTIDDRWEDRKVEIVETLTRMMDGEVPEKTWKAFQKGDVGAFTRRLGQLGTEMPIDRLREKFANDSEFRTYVQRFLRQFEDLFDQATANDHGDLLSSTFVSSDVGRLYEVLCQAAGREAKFNRETQRMA